MRWRLSWMLARRNQIEGFDCIGLFEIDGDVADARKLRCFLDKVGDDFVELLEDLLRGKPNDAYAMMGEVDGSFQLFEWRTNMWLVAAVNLESAA